MGTDSDSRLIQRALQGMTCGDLCLIDMVRSDGADGPQLSLYFADAVDPARVDTGQVAALAAHTSIGGATILIYDLPDGWDGPVRIDGQLVEAKPATPESDMLAGSNALLAVRNGETAAIVLDWLDYHITQHGLTAAVILDRARPGSDPVFAAELKAGLPLLSGDCTVVLVTADQPLGRKTLPPEGHPFCVPGAPGKDRMTVPQPDPWTSPLAALNWYELARHRFLSEARAVANIDVHDLLVPDDVSVFDSAVAADSGLLMLIGRHCYPWRVRDGQAAHFADHICTQFDVPAGRKRWCIAPAKATDKAVWRYLRIGNALPTAEPRPRFFRHMALRHPTDSIATIVPKSSLIEDEKLITRAKQIFGHSPVRAPDIPLRRMPKGRGRRAIVTTMKNEGPFIIDWIAHHRAIGFDDILVYTNDCTDGTDTMLDLLMDRGIVTHRDNPFQSMNLRPQHAALQMAEGEPVIQNAKWVTCIDVDEYVNIKTGDGTLDALFAAVPDANLISMTWRLFGNGDVHAFSDTPVTEQFRHCAAELTRKPHQAWGFKTLFLNNNIFRKLGVHRPKGLNPQLWEMINWVNGSGVPMPRTMFRNGWRSTTETYGYDLVQLNHYAVRSAESFLVKRDRGRVNHVDRDQGLAYWFRMNNNANTDDSIQKIAPVVAAERARLMADPDIAKAHADAVAAHSRKIKELMATPAYASFYARLTDPKLEQLSRLHGHFGANVFLSGPDAIPDDIADMDPAAEWFFTVEAPEKTKH